MKFLRGLRHLFEDLPIDFIGFSISCLVSSVERPCLHCLPPKQRPRYLRFLRVVKGVWRSAWASIPTHRLLFGFAFWCVNGAPAVLWSRLITTGRIVLSIRHRLTYPVIQVSTHLAACIGVRSLIEDLFSCGTFSWCEGKKNYSESRAAILIESMQTGALVPAAISDGTSINLIFFMQAKVWIQPRDKSRAFSVKPIT